MNLEEQQVIDDINFYYYDTVKTSDPMKKMRFELTKMARFRDPLSEFELNCVIKDTEGGTLEEFARAIEKAHGIK
jgi:hypothetical protein